MKKYTIDGNNFNNFSGFVTEVNKKLFDNDHWNGNLDTFNDMLYGGFGTPDENESFSLLWQNAAKSAKELGNEEFIKWRIGNKQIDELNQSIRKEIELAKIGGGTTLFMLIVDIIAQHRNIELVLNVNH